MEPLPGWEREGERERDREREPAWPGRGSLLDRGGSLPGMEVEI